MHRESCTRFRFGQYEIDARARALRKDGVKIRLQEQPFQVLLALLEGRGELVTREQLRQRLWPEGTFVEFDRALNTAVKKIRAALCDDAMMPRYVETIPRRGYRFVHPIDSIHSAQSHSVNNNKLSLVAGLPRRQIFWIVAVILSGATLPRLIHLGGGLSQPHSRGARSLAVLPFTNLSKSSNQEPLFPNLSQVLSARLQQTNPAYLIVDDAHDGARTRAASKKAGELKIDYVLQGGISRDGSRAHVAVQLIRMGDQNNLWAEDFDCEWNHPGSELELAAEIVHHLQPRLASLSGGSR